MNSYSVHELQQNARSILKTLSQDGEAVITNGSQPAALLIRIEHGSLKETVSALHQVRAMVAFNARRKQTVSRKHTTAVVPEEA